MTLSWWDRATGQSQHDLHRNDFQDGSDPWKNHRITNVRFAGEGQLVGVGQDGRA